MSRNIFIEKRCIYKYPQSVGLFNPTHIYKELSGLHDKGIVSTANNGIYDMVRESLAGMGFDRQNYGTDLWNPLGEFLSKGGGQ